MDLPDDLEDHGSASFWRTYRLPIILGSSSLFLVALSVVLLVKSTQTVTPIQFSHMESSSDALGVSIQASQSANLGTILVDIEGAVGNPGVIRLPAGSRVEEAIQSAGGLRSNADTAYISQNINRAMKVADGMKIYIPSLGEATTSYNTSSVKTGGETSHNINQSDSGQSQSGAFISINMASKDQLDSLPGVGPVTAQKIIDNRPYERLEDVVTKKAIGASLFEKLKNSLTL